MPAPPIQLAAAYAVCRGVTRTNARNFYYAFLILPRAKRDALAAVYAFMRHSDDISDDPKLSPQEKSTQLAAWRAELHRVLEGGSTDDPVLFALADAQQRFTISVALLDQLITGTEMDIPSRVDTGDSPVSPIVLYPTFDDLRRYCYHVASVVGLITIRIFGYRDPAAEPLAEDLGVAFQLTNIIRDVKEDAAMGRIYLPADDLAQFGLLNGAADHETPGAPPWPVLPGWEILTKGDKLRPVLALETQRARELYGAADRLLPFIDADCRPALWALSEIYRRLLERIAQLDFAVFGEKVRLSTAEKSGVLARGLWLRFTGAMPGRKPAPPA